MGSPASAETMGSPASAGRAKPAPRPAVTPIPAATSKSPPSPVRRDDGPAVSAPAPASGNGWAGLAIAAAVVALIGAGVAVTSPFWMPPPVGQPLTPAALQQRLGDLESKVSRIALEQGTSPTALDKRVGQVEATVARLEPDHAGLLSTLTGRVVALEKALPTLGQRLSGLPTSPPALAMLLSMVQLRSALATASPFQGELAALELSGGAGDPTVRSTIDQIAERAAIGIPTDGWLIERYPETMHNILRAATADDPIGGLFDQTLGLLSVVAPPLYRWTTNLDAASPRAVADRAEAWMAAGDLARAVDQLSTLTGRPAEAAAPWLAEARARVAADHARTLLGQRMIALVPGGAPAK
ncbi:MAG: hypothetical protein GC168_18605 [Candidatus Hydrogenedens sp.]|nr:hypothetical protein [Candidatus Hydrogenedens sp.]